MEYQLNVLYFYFLLLKTKKKKLIVSSNINTIANVECAVSMEPCFPTLLSFIRFSYEAFWQTLISFISLQIKTVFISTLNVKLVLGIRCGTENCVVTRGNVVDAQNITCP